MSGKIDKTWEDYMVEIIKANTSYPVEREYRFDIPEIGEKKRRWRFDAAIPNLKLAFECNGGVWVKGKHIRPEGYEKDLEKYNSATLQGWQVYKFTPRMLNLGWIEKILEKYK